MKGLGLPTGVKWLAQAGKPDVGKEFLWEIFKNNPFKRKILNEATVPEN